MEDGACVSDTPVTSVKAKGFPEMLIQLHMNTHSMYEQ